ncbi:MAG: GIY-YIG nuclease family protein [Candidatus Omnitrophota bacterium]
MYYVYILKDKKEELYFGYTHNLKRRLKERNMNNNNNNNNNWKFVCYEAYLTELDARKREIQLKRHGQAKAHLKRRLQYSLSFKN